ncbi:MAG: sensor histidine kinase, partial [Acidimicrobiales bacterium]|nr:sensor histidine kinase [Acidimicrobiales bacterium]
VDLAHLLSELMENATHFSPPDTMVEVVGHRGENGTYIISVSDQGIGMSADQLGEANHQLANPPLVGLALSRSLGFIVVGRLAQRFDIDVKLTASPAGGVTGLVTLPSDVVTFEGDDEAPAPEAAAPVDEAPVEEPEVDEIIIVDEVEVEDEVVIDESGGDLLDDLLDESALEVPTDEEFDRGLQELVEEETAAAAPIEDATLAEPEVIEPEPEPVTAPEPEAAPDLPPGITVAEQIAMASRAEAKTADMTAAGLVKRTPKKRSEAAVGGGAPQMPARTTGASQRSPEEVRKMLSRYRSGLNRGRTGGDEGSDGES